MNLQNYVSSLLKPALLAGSLSAGCIGEPPTRANIPPADVSTCQALQPLQIDRFEARWSEANPPGLALEAIVRSPYAGRMSVVGAPATSFGGCPIAAQAYQSSPTENQLRSDGSTLVQGLGIAGAYQQGSCYSIIQYLSNGCVLASEPVFVRRYP